MRFTFISRFLSRPAIDPTNYQEIVKFQSNFPPLFIDTANISQTALFVLNTAIYRTTSACFGRALFIFNLFFNLPPWFMLISSGRFECIFHVKRELTIMTSFQGRRFSTIVNGLAHCFKSLYEPGIVCILCIKITICLVSVLA